MISQIKNVLIILLAILAVYQTGVLWLANLTNQSFLFHMLPFLNQELIAEEANRLVVPRRIILAHPDGRFSVQYSDMEGAREYSDKVISHLFHEGSFVNSRPLEYDLDVFLSFYQHTTNPVYIYEYAFPMKAEWFTQGFGQRSNFLTSRIESDFRRIIIVPPRYGKLDANVFFLCEENYIHEFTVRPPNPGDFDTDIPSDFLGFYYIWAGGQFIRYGEFFFNGIQVANPYADTHGGFTLHFVQEQISHLFSNPASISQLTDRNVWIYRDASAVVRYYDANVLEFINYRAIDRNVPTSFVNDFATAIRFLNRDPNVINDTYLADFREEGSRNIFYFNYVVNNTPLIMPQNWPWAGHLPHPIMVVVDHGTVVNYRKLALNFIINEYVWGIANADFDGSNFENVNLGFRIGNRDIEVLHWFADGRSFPVPHTIFRD